MHFHRLEKESGADFHRTFTLADYRELEAGELHIANDQYERIVELCNCEGAPVERSPLPFTRELASLDPATFAPDWQRVREAITEEEALAKQYLDATAQYLELYRGLMAEDGDSVRQSRFHNGCQINRDASRILKHARFSAIVKNIAESKRVCAPLFGNEIVPFLSSGLLIVGSVKPTEINAVKYPVYAEAC